MFLDAHVSGKRIGRRLRELGHDVRAADAPELEGMGDPEVLELAAAEGRVLVTYNVRDFVPLTQQWDEAGRTHAGVILVPSSMRHEQFGPIVAGILNTLGDTGQRDWIDRTDWLRRP